MLNEAKVNEIESKLNRHADIYYTALSTSSKELNRGYCQGIAFVLEKIGYTVKWDNGKATIEKED